MRRTVMIDSRDKDILLSEYSHIWDYYNKIHENNQRLYENYFRAVSAFGAILAISAAILNSEGIDVDLSYQMILVGIAALGVLGLGLVGFNSIITFAREIGNSEIYLANLKDIRDYLWTSTPSIDGAELEPIHLLRKPIDPTKIDRVSDARLQIFVSLNSFVVATGVFILVFATVFALALFLGHSETDTRLLGLTSALALAAGLMGMGLSYVVQKKRAIAARHNYVAQRIG